jgi:hypothetical protein
MPMFAFDRSALAVLVPLALLMAVVSWSQRGAAPIAQRVQLDEDQGPQVPQVQERHQTVAANLPSR